MTFRFVSNVDGTDFRRGGARSRCGRDAVHRLLKDLHHARDDDQRAHRARLAAGRHAGDEGAIAKHFVAVSTNAKEVAKFGIDTANMFGFWDWVGGRYSMDSAIGLSTMLAIGPDNFRDMLAGFHEMDEHFRTTPFESNLPVLMGLLAIWYNDFFGAQTVAVLPYEQYLKRFPAYLQQLTMESNGKHVTLDGVRVDYDTGPDLLGRAGNQRPAFVLSADPSGHAAHSLRFHRFRAAAQSARPTSRHAAGQCLRADGGAGVRQDRRAGQGGRHAGLARAASAVRGQSPVQHDLAGRARRRQRWASWSRSTSTASSRKATIWQIDSFDQWGVELGKALAQRIIPELESATEPKLEHDSSTNELIRRYRKLKGAA